MHFDGQKRYYVYILTNRSKTLYTGVTSNLEQRVWQHKQHVFPGFTANYKIDRLFYFERYSSVHSAIAREKPDQGLQAIQKDGAHCGAESHLEGLKRTVVCQASV